MARPTRRRTSEFSGEGLVQQRLLQRFQRGFLPLGEAGGVLSFEGVHDFGTAGTMMRPVFGSPKLTHSWPEAAW
jgi:hypothetical protein